MSTIAKGGLRGEPLLNIFIFSDILHSRRLTIASPQIIHKRLRGIPTYVFENHATALIPWAEMRQQVSGDLVLLTLDHHTDCNPAYLRSLFKQVGRDLPLMKKLREERIRNIDHRQPKSVMDALEGLYHDEHIDVALRCGIFKTAFIIQHSYHEILPEWGEQDMVVWPTELDLNKASEFEKIEYYNQILEDDFLTRQLSQLPKGFSIFEHNYILDIDMDLFKTHASLKPHSSRVIKALVEHAVGVTIAQESQWVQRLHVDPSTDIQVMVDDLFDLLEKSKGDFGQKS